MKKKMLGILSVVHLTMQGQSATASVSATIEASARHEVLQELQDRMQAQLSNIADGTLAVTSFYCEPDEI